MARRLAASLAVVPALFLLVALLQVPHQALAQVALPKVSQVSAGECSRCVDGVHCRIGAQGCLADQVKACRMDCPVQYQDPQRYLCPCYSKLGQCLVRIGCSMKQRVDVATFCSRRGYCKDGYCNFRAGDLTPRGDTRPEVFELTSVKTPGTPCIDNCCPTWSNCTQNSTLLAVRNPGRIYREEEVLLPPREGDPRLGVNQNYDRMPYSIPLANLP